MLNEFQISVYFNLVIHSEVDHAEKNLQTINGKFLIDRENKDRNEMYKNK